LDLSFTKADDDQISIKVDEIGSKINTFAGERHPDDTKSSMTSLGRLKLFLTS